MTKGISPDEYDTMTALFAKAEEAIKDTAPAYLKAIEQGYGPKRATDIERVEFKTRDRVGRDETGRYDVDLYYQAPYEEWGTLTSVAVPSSLLWDPDGTTAMAVRALEAERERLATLEAETRATLAAEAERTELARARATAKKHGFRLVKEPK